jgi:GT2 family glycosyltransferase
MLTASVIICTRNRLDPLLVCLQSIAQQTYPISQLIIVDSSDQPLQSLAQFTDLFCFNRFPNVGLAYLHTRPGLTFQRNRGITCATADIVFFFDDDIVLSPQYVEYLMETFHSHPEYGGGMGTFAGVRPVQKRLGDYVRRLFLLNYSAAKGRMQKSGLPTHSHGRSEFMEVEILSGVAAYRASVLREFAFDEKATGYAYMEDVDFSYRVSRCHKLFYDPRAILEHHHAPTGRDGIRESRKMYLVNHNYFFFKNIYPSCHWCIVHYLWAVMGLFAVALFGGHWQALLGYCQGVCDILRKRLKNPYGLSSR